MGIQGPYRMECAEAFPHGVGVVSGVQQLWDFDRSTKDRKVQATEPDGMPIWIVEVMDFNPEARERTYKVKIASPVQPVPPAAIDGAPVRPVILEGLQVMPYQKDVGNGRTRTAYSLRCTGLAAPGRAGRQSSAA